MNKSQLISLVLQVIIIIMLFVIVYQNEINETQILGWVQEYGEKIESIETHLMKTDPSYVQTK